MKHALAAFFLTASAALGQTPTLANSDDIAAAKDRANHTGTQALSTLSQSGATTGQAAVWNGAAWAAATVSGGSTNASDLTSGTVAIARGGTGAGTALAAIDSIGLSSPVEFGHRINTQPYVQSRISGYEAGTAAPIRIAAWGDSFSAGLRPPPSASLSGRFGLVPTTTTGTVTTQNAAVTKWINKATYTFATGSTGLMCFGGSSSNWERGDKCAIAYIKSSSGGTFDLQYESSLNTGTYVTLATINTNNATEVGAYNEYTLPTTNSPFFRLRIVNVTAGSVVLVTAGVYCSDGGGVIWVPIEAASGMSPSEVAAIPNAIMTPIWNGLAPDLMLTAWLETGGTEWGTGGGFRSIYDQTKAIRPATDWVMVGPHYVRTDVAPSVAVLDAQVQAMRDFALEKNETFFDSRPMFRTWAESDALGLMSADGGGQHLSSAGAALRNHHLYHFLPFGRYPLGNTTIRENFFTPLAGLGTEPGTTGTKSYEVPRPLVIRDTSGIGISVWDASNIRDFTKAGRISAAASSDPNALAEIRLGVAGSWSIRASSQMTRITTGFALRTPDNFTAVSSSMSRGTSFAACDSTLGNMTLAIGNSAADTPGRIHIVKKTDATANTVTIDPSGTETIDGASTYVLTAQYSTVTLQSNGTNWYILSKF